MPTGFMWVRWQLAPHLFFCTRTFPLRTSVRPEGCCVCSCFPVRWLNRERCPRRGLAHYRLALWYLHHHGRLTPQYSELYTSQPFTPDNQQAALSPKTVCLLSKDSTQLFSWLVATRRTLLQPRRIQSLHQETRGIALPAFTAHMDTSLTAAACTIIHLLQLYLCFIPTLIWVFCWKKLNVHFVHGSRVESERPQGSRDDSKKSKRLQSSLFATLVTQLKSVHTITKHQFTQSGVNSHQRQCECIIVMRGELSTLLFCHYSLPENLFKISFSSTLRKWPITHQAQPLKHNVSLHSSVTLKSLTIFTTLFQTFTQSSRLFMARIPSALKFGDSRF